MTIATNDKFITDIFNKYLLAKGIIDSYYKEFNQEKVNNYQINNYKNHIQMVETTLALIPKVEYKFITKEFIIKKQNWWKNSYKIDDYKNLRVKAINHFLYLYLI